MTGAKFRTAARHPRPPRRPSVLACGLAALLCVCRDGRCAVSSLAVGAPRWSPHRPTAHRPWTRVSGGGTCRRRGGGLSAHLPSLRADPVGTDAAIHDGGDGGELLPMVSELNVKYNASVPLVYSPACDRYAAIPSRDRPRLRGLRPVLRSAFLPDGVTSDYYRYIRWRIVQRFLSAVVHVFGTQCLLLGLGIKNGRGLGIGAALNWVLKDALGKLVRMVWASRMGRKFDTDAKRWRFRSSILFAAGNGLEVATYVWPSLFLLWAATSNGLKQAAMLTSSATRNALYNSFRKDGRENIGDITAKGEAQIAVVDLLGILSGVMLSRIVGMSVKGVISTYVFLQVVEIMCMFQEIRSVVFKMLNFERMWGILAACVQTPPHDRAAATHAVPTPAEVAHTERIFLPPRHFSRRAVAFGSLGRARLSPPELRELLQIFRGERYLLVVGHDDRTHNKSAARRRRATLDPGARSVEDCHIVLHAEAVDADIVRSGLALAVLRRNLAECAAPDGSTADDCVVSPDSGAASPYVPLRSGDCMDLIRRSKLEAEARFPGLLRDLQRKGWTKGRFMFGRVNMRNVWEIQPKRAPAASKTVVLPPDDGLQ